MISSVGTRMDALEARLISLDVAVSSIDALNVRLEALFARVKCFEDSVSRVDGLTQTVNKLSITLNGISADHVSLAGRIADLESRCAASGCSAAPGPMCLSSPLVVDDLASRIRSFEQRDQELIIFGLPDGDGDRDRALMSLAGALGLEFSRSGIVNSIRIRGSQTTSRPLVVRFASVAGRNEWLSAARRHRGITARSVCDSWPENRISIYERSTAAERHAFAEAKTLARERGIKNIWMRRGVIYFRSSGASQPCRYSSPDSFEREGFVAHADRLPASAPLNDSASGGVSVSPI